MVSDETYELCLPILQDPNLDDEEKTDKLEELLKEKTTLSGQALENAILDALWRFRDGGTNATSPPAIRHSILRRPSPAPWRGSGTPVSGSPRLGVSPLAPPGFMHSPFGRTKSSTASPFGSPRPSPRLAFAAPVPHSPSLSAYQFATDVTPCQEVFGDYQSDNVDWLVSDDAVSVTSSIGGTFSTGGGLGTTSTGTTSSASASGLNVAAPEFVSQRDQHQQQADMTPLDMLRSILGQSKTDEEITQALAAHGYDLGATISAFMEQQQREQQSEADGKEGNNNNSSGSSKVVIGKAMTPNGRPATPAEQPPTKTGVICKYFLSTGQCLRADCRFSHDLSSHLCKYWLAGNCLAGNTCIFSHDPAHLINRLNMDGTNTPPTQHATVNLQDYNSFPALQPGTPEQYGYTLGVAPPPGFRHHERPRSRPGSRHQHKDNNSNNNNTQTAPSPDDADAFPSLGSVVVKQAKKHGKRGGHGHGSGSSNKDGNSSGAPTTLADVVKMSPSPSPSAQKSKAARNGGNSAAASTRNSMENSAAAQAIPPPKHIPWLETGERANKGYLKARAEAIKHGGLRNKFLQSAAQAWNRNDARAAKALSLRGQSENDLMRKAHREAARQLYEDRHKPVDQCPEIYVDLHGLHPEEAVEYLESVMTECSEETRPIYVITGTSGPTGGGGKGSGGGKDKVGKAVRNWLNEWRFAWREFAVPGDGRGTNSSGAGAGAGSILGVDARSWDRGLSVDGGSFKRRENDTEGNGEVNNKEKEKDKEEGSQVQDLLAQGVEIGEGKVKLLVRDTSSSSSSTTTTTTTHATGGGKEKEVLKGPAGKK